MTPHEIAALKKRILAASVYYGRQFTTDVIDMYVEFLSDLSMEDVMNAIKAYCMNGKNKFMFNAAQLREIINPEPSPDDVSREIASRITQAVTQYGYCNTSHAREYIGEIGWEVVQRKGGWNHICQNLGVSIDPTVFEAQCRELSKIKVLSGTQPNYEMLLNVASYGNVHRMPQPASREQLEERKTLLLNQVSKLKPGSEA